MNKPIYVTRPDLPSLGDFVPYLEQIWDNKWLTNNGPFHQQLEQALCDYLGVKHISLFANGTIALITAQQALGITGEVITTPYSFVATAHSLLWNGVKPVFIDIDPITLNDIKRLSKLAKRCYPPHYAYLWFDNGEWYTETMYTVEKLALEIADPNVVYFIASADKTDLGYMKLALDYPLSIGQGFSFGTGNGSQISAPNALYLDRIYLAENAVGKGIGTKLVDLCVEMACKLDKTAV